jgi:YVTN family beta-propeller protein
VTNQSSNGVFAIDTATNTVTAAIPVGAGPRFIAFEKTLSPEDQIPALIAQVEALIANGTLTQNQGDGLIDKLNQVIAKLAAHQTGAACNQMSAFINQVQPFINSGVLTQAQGQSLINAANAIKVNLGC